VTDNAGNVARNNFPGLLIVTTDAAPPVLTDLVVNTPLVNTTTAPAGIRLTLTIQDDSTGVSLVRFTRTSPAGVSTTVDCTLVGGTSLNGTFECADNLPQLSEEGVWSISAFIEDAAGNSRTYSTTELAGMGIASTFINKLTFVDALFANLSGQLDRFCNNDGVGSFVCSDVPASTNAFGVAVGDINKDGNLDAVFANFGQTNRVCLGDSLGGFTCSDVSAAVNNSTAVALGDVNGDGNLDAVFANLDQANQVCLGDGLGSFACSNVSGDANSTKGLALGDINRDGFLDAVFANQGQTNRFCWGDGLGAFTCGNVSTDLNNSAGVALGDVNGDGNIDAVFANINQANRICLGDGGISFTCSDASPDADFTVGVALGDVNADNWLDIVFANSSSQPNRLCLSDGLGGFDCSNLSPDANDSNGVALADVNQDGFTDAIFANQGQTNRRCLGDGNGGFACSDVSANTDSSNGAALGAIGLDDLAMAAVNNNLSSSNPNQPLQIFATIRNNGPVDITSARILYFLDLNSNGTLDGGEPSTLNLATNLHAGTSRVVAGVFQNPPAGSYQAVPIIDPDNRLLERDENNNSGMTTLVIVKPDLTTVNLTYSAVLTNSCSGKGGKNCPKYNLELQAVIANVGDASVSGVQVRFESSTDGGATFSGLGGPVSTGAIGPGSTSTATQSINNTGPGNLLIRVTVDPNNTIGETDEGNNMSTFPVTVP
jgi:hypothetical protein